MSSRIGRRTGVHGVIRAAALLGIILTLIPAALRGMGFEVDLRIDAELVKHIATPSGAVSQQAAPTRPSMPVEREVGSIRVTVETAGTVYLDGEELGRLDGGQGATIGQVPAGTRTVEVGYEDGERETITVAVRGGETATARFSYVERPVVGSAARGYQLTIVGLGTSNRLYVNGDLQTRETERFSIQLPPGRHEIRVVQSNGVRLVGEVDLSDELTINWPIQMIGIAAGDPDIFRVEQ